MVETDDDASKHRCEMVCDGGGGRTLHFGGGLGVVEV